ncbi:hypothetical protein LIER_35893 [Lithospermum erythrorhizon]|uniref:DUF4378 domain-containing protein n=1 Tax=Lithospermum erythrorhizon TaxID=34254 RepID=A0AAV3P0J7_LITER
MPQDSLRSIVYRSFVTCDDPGGIVECKTIRRSKATKKLGGKVENAKSEKNLVASSHKDIRKETSSNGLINKFDSSSSARSKEVSEGAQKLSNVVDSLSTNSLESQSEDIAKKLLKGAVNLQESLKMLGRFQEASKFMTSFKKKEKSGDRNSLQRSYSERFTDHSNVIDFQKPRLSADGGSSKDCYDELRDVIRESFGRQNLLQKGSSKERESAERNVDSSVYTPSASSSQSSTFNSHDFISSGSSSSNVQSERPKGSNLIAKLMGLDELASDPVQFIPNKPLGKSSESTNKRNILDLDLPIARKPSFIVHKAKPDQRTLGEIIEIMQSKGLMRDKSFEEPTQKWRPYEVSDFSDDSPPIVVMKPLHKYSLDKEFPHINNCTCGRASSKTKEMLKLWRTRERVSSKNIEPPEALSNPTMQRKTIAGKHAVLRISREKETKSFEQARARPKLKESEIEDTTSPIRPKASGHVTSHLQKGEVIEKRVDKIHRVAPKVKNGEERNQITESNSGRDAVSKANHQRNINSKQITSIPRESLASSKKVVQNKNSISRSRTTKMLSSPAKQKKPIKHDKLSDTETPVAVEIIGNGTIDIGINLELDNEDGMLGTSIIQEPVSSMELRDISDICSSDDTKPSSESSNIIIQQNVGALGDDSEVNCISSLNKSWKYQTTVRSVLSSSISFLNHAEELFDTTACQSLLVEATSLDNDELPDAKLILACATELLECKCQQWELTVYPLLQHPKQRPKISVSFEHLVEKICDELGKLKDNGRLSSDDLHIDYFYAMLRKDLWCNGAVSGAWDLGWMNAFTWDEVEQVVDYIEEELLGRIVEDLVSDLLL